MLQKIRTYFLFLFLSGICGTAFSQTILNAMVADSATLRALPYVNIRIKNSPRGTMANGQGYFLLEAKDTDTLTFSMVGYYSKRFSAKEVRERIVIYLTEESKMLAPITIDGSVLIPGLKKIKAESAWKNPTQDQRVLETPGFQGIQTFGPGYVMRGFISRYSKGEKEKTKLQKVQEENRKARGYVEIVNDPEVKGKLMKEYALTEDEYYRHLAVFNEKNKDFIYDLAANELTSLLFIFFEENARRK
jgi:hypothetical protein